MNSRGAIPGSLETAQDTTSPRHEDERRTKRVRSWRRRVLQRRGALMHAAMAQLRGNSSLAMLDETGVVVSWYGQAGAPSEHVVDRHVSQFYIPEDIARGQPLRDLNSAVVGGSSIRQGWRRNTDGTTFWGTVVIEAVVLRDGRLQGFSYLSRECGGPRADVPTSESLRPPMTRVPGVSRFGAVVLGLCSLFASLPVAAEPNELPAHARASRYGSGWDCSSGFRRVGDTCVHVVVPANAYLEASGSAWRCNRGYLNLNERCVAIHVPQNAYLDDAYGTGWRCDRDYREASGVCVPIEVPSSAHATGSAYGSGWECNRGFHPSGSACLPVAVPAHGFLSRAGDNWECERGFRKDDAACVTVQVPANAHLNYSGDDWRCDEGFHAHGTLCVAD